MSKFLLACTVLFSLSVKAQDTKNETKGAATFSQQCASCHGADGKAQTTTGKQLNAADLTSSSVQQMSDAQIAKVVKHGNGKMPPVGENLSDDEIKAVVAYVKQLGKGQ
ncbi:MAG TPA: cytochrome c [Bryobacteraceae bacterium]|nr:cytochrome c [Bryobacteraceae bacterium]